MSLEFEARVAARGFEVSLEVADNERVAVLGHNGSGKSTLLGLIAGTLRPDSGRAVLDGRVLFDIDEDGKGAWTPLNARGVAMLAQDPLLFPHMTLLQNAAFGPRASGSSRKEARETADCWLGEVGIPELRDRRPSEVSGGQAQRAAIARALATVPSMLLLDEPMAALDVAVAPALRRVLRQVLTDQATMMVTHDLLDAVMLSDRVIVLEAGKITEDGPTEDVLEHPRTRFAARLAGLNLVRGIYRDGAVVTRDGTEVRGSQREGSDELATNGMEAAAVFPPSAVSVFLDNPHGSPQNNLRGTISELEPNQELVRVRTRIGEQLLLADVTVQAVAQLDLHPGKEVVFSVKASAIIIYPA
ncbi:ATP-binding cassette domain-containing protein [Actinomycetaceae bacterium MB13-C1-2]|nr:ATP-binding cassette domain-containing protein [Actinomycetaceae bacterium MB13-C1-2]